MQINRGKQHNGKDQRSLQEPGDIKETFHARMGTITDKNGKDLTKAEKIKKKQQEYTEVYKKILMAQITMLVWSLT